MTGNQVGGLRALIMVWLALVAALFLAKFVPSLEAHYARLVSPAAELAIASLSKLAFLVCGAWLAAACVRAFSGQPVERSWRLLAVGLAVYVVGQASLGYYHLYLLKENPFPSSGDFFFVVAMGLWVAALVSFLTSYREAGYPMGERRSLLLFSGVVVAALLGLGWFLLKPVLAVPAPMLEQTFNLAYPVLDILVLVPSLILLRVTLQLKGGRVWRFWALLLGGFFCMAGGDVFYAYFATAGQEHLAPLVDVMFVAAYALIALAVLDQYEVSVV